MRKFRDVALAAVLLFVSGIVPVLAQGAGAIAGRVTDAATGAGIADANVRATSSAGRAAGAVNTAADGSYRIAGLAAGTYAVSMSKIGYGQKTAGNVTVAAGVTATANASLTAVATSLTQVTVTTSRGKQERVLDAPAQISVVTQQAIEERPSLTVADHLKSTAGIDVTVGGLTQTNIVSRGFNNAFSGSMLMLQDYRFAGVPSLRVNVPLLFTGSNDDIQRVEVLLGPASALYGPNSGAGVLHVITKSPFDSKGTTFTMDVGERSVFRTSIRHANTIGDRVGYKISAEQFTGRDWDYIDPAEPVRFDTAQRVPVDRRGDLNPRDLGVRKNTFEARVDLRPTDDLTLISTVGYTNIPTGTELTGANGTSQVRDWTYLNFQQRVNYRKFFGQIFLNENNAGNNSGLSPNGTFLRRSGQPVVDQSRVLALQAIQAFDWGTRQQFTIGGDFIWTNPRTGGTINGNNETGDNTREVGAFIQSETKLTSKWDLIAALRLDQHSAIDETFFSPRLALLWRPDAKNTLRVSYNRAFGTPANFAFFLDLISTPNAAPGFDVRAAGNPPKAGWTFDRSAGCAAGIGGLCMRTPFYGAGGPVSASSGTALPGLFAALSGSLRAGFTPAITAALQAPPFSLPAATAAALAANAVNAYVNTLPTLTPTDAQVGSRLAFVTSPFAPITPASLTTIAPLKAAYNSTYEIGWKGLAFDKLRFDASFWYQQRADIGTSAALATPSVYSDPTLTQAYLAGNASLIAAMTAQLGALGPSAGPTAAAFAASLASGMYCLPVAAGGTCASATAGTLLGAPLATISFDNRSRVRDGSVLATYQSITGKTIDVLGMDLSTEYSLTDTWTLLGTASWLNKNVFDDLGNIGGNNLPVMSNSPKLKGTATIRYANSESGWSGEARVRTWSSYPINSGVYASGYGFKIPAGNPGFLSSAVAGVGKVGPGLYQYPAVTKTGVIDLSGSYRFKGEGQLPLLVSISVTNLLGTPYNTFAGAPEIGRLVTGRMSVTW